MACIRFRRVKNNLVSRASEVGGSPDGDSYIKLGTWDLSNVDPRLKSLKFTVNSELGDWQIVGNLIRNNEASLSSGVDAAKLYYSQNNSADGTIEVYATSTHTYDLFIHVNSDVLTSEYTYKVEYMYGSWMDSREYQRKEPSGTKLNVTIRPSDFHVGSGLSLSSSGELSSSMDHDWTPVESSSPYINMSVARTGKIVIFRFDAYRSDGLGWGGEASDATSGSKWGVKLGTLPSWAIPNCANLQDDAVREYRPVFSRWWTGITLFALVITSNGDISYSYNIISGPPSTCQFTTVYYAAN